MRFEIKSLKIFREQIEKLDGDSKRLISSKIELIKENPYRYKRVRSKKYSKVFRIRFNLQRQETRLIYVVIEPNIILVCLLERKRDYKDLEKYLAKLKREIKI